MLFYVKTSSQSGGFIFAGGVTGMVDPSRGEPVK